MKFFIVSVLLVFSFSYLSEAAAGCKTGWVHGGGSCYRFITTEVSWNKAQGICRDLGGQLAVVDNLEKSAFIAGYLYLHSEFRSKGWLVGGRRGKNDNDWRWQAGGFPPYAFTYTNWYPGQPDGADYGEECLELGIYAPPAITGVMWNDVSCDSPRAYICEITADLCHGSVIG